MSYISQLASTRRVGEGEGELGNRSPYHYTTWLREGAGRGVVFPPLDISGSRLFLNPDPDQDPGFYHQNQKNLMKEILCISSLTSMKDIQLLKTYRTVNPI